MGALVLSEQAAASTPSAGDVALYPKTDGILYAKDDAGTEYQASWVAATQAQQETGTVVTAPVTPGRQQYHPSAAKVWCNWQFGGTTIDLSYNMSSITDSAVGVAILNFNVGFSSSVFVACPAIFGSGQAYVLNVSSAAAGSVTVKQYNAMATSTTVDGEGRAYCACFGDQ